MPFRILPPLWRRSWVITMAGLLLSAAAYGIHLYRLTRVVELERVRMAIATDLHDDIGSGLSQVAILSEVAQRQLGSDGARLSEPLARISTVSRELVSSMSDIVWAINPHRDSMRNLIQHMRRFASDVLSPQDIHFEFHINAGDQDLKLGAEIRRQVFLVFKECVNNMARHSKCQHASIECRVENRQFLLRLRDDGQGFDPSGTFDGHGLSSMAQRASKLAGHVTVTSNARQGTTITLQAPLEHRRWRTSFLPE